MIKELVNKYSEYAISLRRNFHKYPELSTKEFNTSNTIKEALEQMGLKVERIGNLPSVIGILETGKPGKTIMLRADIDALPVIEKNNVDFKSENENMHACGHDIHIASQLLSARVLTDLKDQLTGTIKFFFQSAEEVGLGALDAINDGLLNDVDMILSYHVLPLLNLGEFNFEEGYRMAAYDSFEIKVNGTATHGSQPHLGADAIVAASNIVTSLQALTSRLNDAFEPLVITIGTINGGTRPNIICNEVVMKGSIRYFNEPKYFDLEEKIRTTAINIAKIYDCNAKVDYKNSLPSLNNKSKDLIDKMNLVITKNFSKESVVKMRALPLSEDFAFFNEIPSLYGFIGSKSDLVNSNMPNHSDLFNPDEQVISYAATIFSAFIYDNFKA